MGALQFWGNNIGYSEILRKSRLNTETSSHLRTKTSEGSGSTWIIFTWYIESFEASSISEKAHLYSYVWGNTQLEYDVCTARNESKWVDIFRMIGDKLLPSLTSSSHLIFDAYELKKSGDCLVSSWSSRLFITLSSSIFSFGCSILIWVDIFMTKSGTLLPSLTSSSNDILEASELKKSGDCLVSSWSSRHFITLLSSGRERWMNKGRDESWGRYSVRMNITLIF